MDNLKFFALSPQKELEKYVRRVLITVAKDSPVQNLPIGPTGFCYLTYSRYPAVIHYSNRVISFTKAQLYLAGQLLEEQPYLRIKGQFFHVGLELYPATLHHFFGIEGNRLLDNFALMRDVDKTFNEKGIAEIGEQEMAELVAEKMQSLLLNKVPVHPQISFLQEALDFIYTSNGNLEVNHLVEKLNVSERHFRRVFKKVIGLGAKQYCKVLQFNAAFNAIHQGKEAEIYNVALQTGYYDHAHFINDFKSILGQSPQQFLKSDHSFLKDYLGGMNGQK